MLEPDELVALLVVLNKEELAVLVELEELEEPFVVVGIPEREELEGLPVETEIGEAELE